MIRPQRSDEFGCDSCRDDQNRWYGHLDQLGSNEDGLILLRCPRCSSLYENTAGGWDATRRLTKDEAHGRFPDAAWPPLLLLDVDGVLMPVGRSLPPGFVRHRTDEYDVVIAESHGEWLRALVPLFDLVWATTWGTKAGEIFGRLLDLPEAEAVPLTALAKSGTRELPDVARFVGDRPFAWVDDELYEDAFEWASARGVPSLLVRTDAGVGLREREVDLLRVFGEQVASR